MRDQSILEWVPQETMLFDGALAHSETHIHLDHAASFIGWDMLVLGRQARAERFVQEVITTSLSCGENKNYWLQIHCFEGEDRWLSSCLGMNNQAVMGSFGP